MKSFNEFIKESIQKNRVEEIQDNFVDWADQINQEEGFKSFNEFKEYIYDNISDFADEYNLSNDELDELTHPANEKVPSFDLWIADFEEDFK